VEEAAWQLVRECRETGDGGLAAFTGRVLALLGPLPPERIAFTPPKAAAAGGNSHVPDRSHHFACASALLWPIKEPFRRNSLFEVDVPLP